MDVDSRPSPAILVAISDETIRATLVNSLRKEGYTIQEASNGERAFHLAQQQTLLLALLDRTLSGRDGIEMCRLLRNQQETAWLPILILATHDDEVETVVGLEVGADDYVIWPQNWMVLHARIRALLRRSRYMSLAASPLVEAGKKQDEHFLEIGNLRIDLAGHAVMRHNQPIDLSARLFDLLVYLVRHRGSTIPRKHLQEYVLGAPASVDERIIDSYVHWLREKLEDDPTHPTQIQTVRGIGYRFSSEE